MREIVAVCRPHLRKTLGVAAVVGTVLFAINQLDTVIRGDADATTWAKSGLTYVVPFLVANYGVVMGARREAREARAAASAGLGRGAPGAQ